MALKQRAEQSTHSETLGWEEEEEGMLFSSLHGWQNDWLLKPVAYTRIPTVTVR